jgi:hypothetical protein
VRNSPAPQAPRAQLKSPAARQSAVLDEAHLGDIEGALGRIRVDQDVGGGFKRRLITFLAIVGPGLIVMVGDNDAGGVSTYSEAGQNYGYSLLWTLLLLIPVLIVNQEMVVRLGAVTGVGHARLINERFGRFWGWFSVGDLPLRGARRPGRRQLRRGAAHHRDRGDHGRALAVVLPAVQRHRQAHHAAVHRL